MIPYVYRADCPLVKVYLAVVLIYRTTNRQVEGYPSIHNEAFSTAGLTERVSSSTGKNFGMRPTHDISGLVQVAYDNFELLRPEQWSMRFTDIGAETGRPVQRDTSQYREAVVDTTSVYSKSEKRQENRSWQNPEEKAHRDQESASTHLDGKIVFPTDDEGVHDRAHDFRTAPVCRGSTFCENAVYYPQELVNVAIQRNNSLKFLAGIDEVSDIAQRIDATDETPLCVSTERVVYPQSAENKRKEWLFVVNQDNFKQGIRIEICRNEDRVCDIIDGFSEGYRTTCKQKFIYRQLAAVGSDGNVISDMFRFPSSCCCHVKFTGNPLVRMGTIDEASNRTTMLRRSREK